MKGIQRESCYITGILFDVSLDQKPWERFNQLDFHDILKTILTQFIGCYRVYGFFAAFAQTQCSLSIALCTAGKLILLFKQNLHSLKVEFLEWSSGPPLNNSAERSLRD